MENKRRKILFQGDSITDGNWGRNLDPNHILGHGYVYIIAAQLGSQYAESQPYFMNRGVSGNRVSDVYARWNEDAISLQPDLISLLVGVNDVHSIITGSARGLQTGMSESIARCWTRHAKYCQIQRLYYVSRLLCIQKQRIKIGASGAQKWKSTAVSFGI